MTYKHRSVTFWLVFVHGQERKSMLRHLLASGGGFILCHIRGHRAGEEESYSLGPLACTSHCVIKVGPPGTASQRPHLQALLIYKFGECLTREHCGDTLKPQHRVWLRQELGFSVCLGDTHHTSLIVRLIIVVGL